MIFTTYQNYPLPLSIFRSIYNLLMLKVRLTFFYFFFWGGGHVISSYYELVSVQNFKDIDAESPIDIFFFFFWGGGTIGSLSSWHVISSYYELVSLQNFKTPRDVLQMCHTTLKEDIWSQKIGNIWRSQVVYFQPAWKQSCTHRISIELCYLCIIKLKCC